MATFRAGVMSSVGAQYLNFIFGFVKLAVVSRILSPEDIGTFTLAISLVMLAQVVRLFGTWDYIVAQSVVSEHTYRACFTIVAVTSYSAAVIFFLSSSWLSEFFGAPKIAWLLPILTLSFLIFPFALMAQAKISREMNFSKLSVIRVVAGLVDAILVIALVSFGHGVESLAFGFLAGVLVSTTLVAVIEPNYILFRPTLRGLAPILRFGASSTLSGLLNSVNQYGPGLILGRIATPISVGYFARGQTLVQVFRQGLDMAAPAVTQSWFANKLRERPGELVRGYQKICEIATGLSWPFYIFLIFYASTLVPLILGEQWVVSVPVTKALACGGMFSTISVYGSSLLGGIGEVNKRLLFSIIAQSIRVTLLVYAAFQNDLVAFAWGVALSEAITCGVMLCVLKVNVGLSVRGFAYAMRRSAVLASLVVILNGALVLFIFDGLRLSILQILAAFFCSLMALIVVAHWIKHPVSWELKRIFRKVKGVLSSKAEGGM